MPKTLVICIVALLAERNGPGPIDNAAFARSLRGAPSSRKAEHAVQPGE